MVGGVTGRSVPDLEATFLFAIFLDTGSGLIAGLPTGSRSGTGPGCDCEASNLCLAAVALATPDARPTAFRWTIGVGLRGIVLGGVRSDEPSDSTVGSTRFAGIGGGILGFAGG